MSKGRILFQLSGSIACYKSCYVLSRLVQSGYDVRVVATKNALEFVGRASLEGLSGHPVFTDVFEPGEMMGHIHLMKWADLAILCPASANSISKLAHGVGGDLLTTLFLAYDFKKPYLLAPAMNTQMYRHPATQEALARLKAWGIEVLETESGLLACGDTGEGRLIDPDRVYMAIEEHFRAPSSRTPNPLRGSPPLSQGKSLKVLITSGGTREPIDGVRFISNFSSGRTGAQIADHFVSHGHTVTFLHAEGSAKPVALNSIPRHRTFLTYRDLDEALQEELSRDSYDVILHMAAVSDYSIEKVEMADSSSSLLPPEKPGTLGKIDSTAPLTIRLKPNAKLVDNLRSYSRNPSLKVVAFKLTNSPLISERIDAVEKLALRARPDFIVHNDLQEIDPSGDRHVCTLYSVTKSGFPEKIFQSTTKSMLADRLGDCL